MKKFLSLTLVMALALFSVGTVDAGAAEDRPATLIVDMTAEDHEILHGSAGFLYGISNEGVPDVNTLTPLKPKVLATKGPLGTEHPYGDALDVAEEFFEAGGQQVQMYNSNYYGVFGVTADANDYGKVLRETIAPHVAQWKDEKRAKYPDIDSRLVYIPINEGTPVNVNGGQNFNAAWKIYYDAIKTADPGAYIAGPNDAVYRGHNNMYDFIRFCKENNCLPDIFTWHELQVGCLDTMDDHIADYRAVSDELGVERKQVVINEYADYSDCGVPGRLVNWIARLEDNQVYGCLPFWHQANNLNDLAAEANQGNGAWWVYKWYGDMSGRTLNVTAENTGFDGLYGVAAIDENKRSASVIFGGADGETRVKLDNISEAGIFAGAEKVHIKVEASYFSGYHGAAYEPETVMEGVFPVVDGAVSLSVGGTLFSTAYRLTVTEAFDDAAVTTGRFHAEYEAEDAVQLGSTFEDHQYTPLESPSYYCSGGVRVGGIDSDGDGIEYIIDVPVDGRYRLNFIYGNGVGSTRNDQNTHAPKNITNELVIDGAGEEISLPNTLFYSMEGNVERYVDLKAGRHRIALMYNGQAGAFHDVLYVSYSGAFGQERPEFNKRYEAELADFNSFGAIPARTESVLDGFSGNGYVTGLENSPVESGGGIRWVADVEESGFYHLNFRYRAEVGGNIRVYLDNTNLTYNNKLTETEMTVGGWADTHITAFLRRGINIIDIDTDAPAAVDYMQIIRAGDEAWTVEAESAGGSFETAVSGDVTYVKEMKAKDEYLEFSVNVPSDGPYRMRVFQSNNDLCGTHSYNIKIIDRYAVFEVNGENAGRYFFPNSFSDDTFLEKTVTLDLKAGENKIKVYNDDSWQVFWGGSTWEPGTNRLENYTPNFDRFVISPALIEAELPEPEYSIDITSSGDGYIYADRNSAKAGETVRLYLVPDGIVKILTVNGNDIASELTSEDNQIYTVEITVTGETKIYAEFTGSVGGGLITDGEDGEYYYIDGRPYKIKSGNLFDNGDFADYSGEHMEQWYTGVNTGGHPDTNNYQVPRINPDGSIENLIPLTKSGWLTAGGQEIDNPDTFYYGYDGSRTYLVEHMADDWHTCAWNGQNSLLAFVPIKPETKYYFAFSAYTAGGRASVRCGAINMDNYVPEIYDENASLNFSGSGGIDCTNGNVQNVGGGWTEHSGVIDSGDGDYFLFNAYWLQMADYLCLGNFRLYELSNEPAEMITSVSSLPTLVVPVGGEPVLPESVEVETESGAVERLTVNWLNADIVDTDVPGVYTVTGRLELPDRLYYGDNAVVKQRVIVKAAHPVRITEVVPEEGAVNVTLISDEAVAGTLYVSADGSAQVKSKELRLVPGEAQRVRLSFEKPWEILKAMFWNGSLSPLAAAVIAE